MNEFTDILVNATRSVLPAYFQVQTAGDTTVYRERVYCYELYHQMRLRWPNDADYRLNGELDKVAHPVLQRLELAGCKPDLLVHRPGTMEGNYAVLEIKTVLAQNEGIKKDLQTLTGFIARAGYQRALYLLFGEDPNRTIERIRAVAATMSDLPNVELWVHSTPRQAAVHVQTLRGA